MTRTNHKTILCLSAAIAAMTITVTMSGAALAQDTGVVLGERKAAIFGDQDNFGSVQSGNNRARVSSFLESRGASPSTIASLVEISAHSDASGRTFARYEQRINDLRVHGSVVKAAFDAGGNLIHLIELIAPAGGRIAPATLGPAEAARFAIDRSFGSGVGVPRIAREDGANTELEATSFFYRAPRIEKVVIARGAQLQEAFLVEIWSAGDNRLYHTLVDGFGRIVSNELRTNNDSYNIFTDHPSVSAQTIVDGPGAGNAQSPQGWLSGPQNSIHIQGNNVAAYLDRNGNNLPDAGGTDINDGSFVTPANLAQSPTTAANQDTAVQNLFYLNNLIHDTLYQHGFVEGAGNFQEDNFGNGGAGSDSVNAEAQDGDGTNNANFATPPDGFNPRMQMFLWTQTNPNRDSSLDSDVVWHEYSHGLTWRMIGAMSGSVSGAIGEGMGDVLAIIQNDDDRVGEYSVGDPFGIRSAPYDLHQDTIGDFSPSRGVHRNGEIYAAVLWDLWNEYKESSYTKDDILDDIVGGMNFTPPRPDYFDMRDGLIAAAPVERDCLIWENFAGAGMGVGGSMNFFGTQITESFAVPAECSGPGPMPELASISTTTQSVFFNLFWRGIMTANIEDENGGPLSDVEVSVVTDGGAQRSCTTKANGACFVFSPFFFAGNTPSVEFTVTALEGDTNAAGVPLSITVNRP